MAEARAKRFAYAAAIDRSGRMSTQSGPPVELPEGWSAEALVLAGLARCSITSLAYHARRASVSVTAAADVSGTVTKRDSDGRYAFVEIESRLDVELDPLPPGEELRELLVKAERDCFISASLTAAPAFRWRVNGREV